MEKNNSTFKDISNEHYSGKLGCFYTNTKTNFFVWAPEAVKVELNLYSNGNDSNIIESLDMKKGDNGVWLLEKKGDLNHMYYTYNTYFKGGKHNLEIVDPYAKSVGLNGERGQILDLDETNPDGWEFDTRCLCSPVDMQIYEVHIRDFSSHIDNGIKNKGKYLAFTEKDTRTFNGFKSGIAHLKELGISHIHLLPTYDFGSVDEKGEGNLYNWGYDPVNYNALEGSFSSNPYKGEVRIKEYKEMVKSLHDEGIGIIVDVVFNHTYKKDFCFNKLAPNYFHRPDSNGSFCGNDVATERSMVRKFIVDTIVFWAKEYHIDGFRFDLMGLIDIDTMNEIRRELDNIDDRIFIYGEGWEMNTRLVYDIDMAIKSNASKTKGIAYFSDIIRDSIRGSNFEHMKKGYIGGELNEVLNIKDGISYSKSFSPSPLQTINYISCHDDLTIWDKINISMADENLEKKIKMNLLAASIIQTSQGVPFIMSGEEFLRTKKRKDGTFDDNSYKSGDAINALDYNRKCEYEKVYKYYKDLIHLRKNNKGFRLSSAKEVAENLVFIEGLESGIIAYRILSQANDGKGIFVAFNPLDKEVELKLPDGKWRLLLDGSQFDFDSHNFVEESIILPNISTIICIEE